MSRFKDYRPDQAYLLPRTVRDELGEDHLCFFIRRVIQRLDLGDFERAYSAEGGTLYAPELMLSVWLYAYALGITSARQVERRLVEDLPMRYLAAGERVDNWSLSAFRRRHALGAPPPGLDEYMLCKDELDLTPARGSLMPARDTHVRA